MVGYCLIREKGKLVKTTIKCYSLSFTVTCYHVLSLDVSRCTTCTTCVSLYHVSRCTTRLSFYKRPNAYAQFCFSHFIIEDFVALSFFHSHFIVNEQLFKHYRIKRYYSIIGLSFNSTSN